MRVVNQYADPHCVQSVSTWSQGSPVTVTRDGRQWHYRFNSTSSLMTSRTNGISCVIVAATPSVDGLKIENAETLMQTSRLLAVDASKETRNFIGLSGESGLDFTMTAITHVAMSEWPILQEVDANIFAADTAAY